MQLAIGQKLLARIEKYVGTVDMKDDECGGELIEGKITGVEDAPAAIGNTHGAGLKACGTRQGKVERGYFVAGAPLLAPDLGGVAERLCSGRSESALPGCVRAKKRCFRDPARRRTACAPSRLQSRLRR